MRRNSRNELPSSTPPTIEEHHVRLPDELSEILRANTAHARGIRGGGIRIAIIDSGFYAHPFYESRGYRISRVPTRKEPEPERDEYGHGTAQLASLFAIAPDAEVIAIKCLDKDPCYSLRKAIALKPDVLICAWGFDLDHPGTKELPPEYEPIRKLILRALKKGICVIAAAGNGQYAFPGNMPEVISAGGVFYTQAGEFTISDVASRFKSSIFPGREVPDVCGLVGNLPHGRLLLVPVPPKARLAKRPAFGAKSSQSNAMIAAGEHAALGDSKKLTGWALFSGTSAATAMIAGAAALLLQLRPELEPDQLKHILIKSANSAADPSCPVIDVESALGFLEQML
jgi:subtilisin family serine protease